MSYELMILDAIQQIRFGFLDSLMTLITHLGDAGIIWIVLSIILLINKSTRKIGLVCLLAVFFSGLITNLGLKNLVGRARPYNYRDIELLIKTPWDYSFPSGHTSAAFSVTFVLLREQFKLKGVRVDLIALILAILMAFSRMYLYVHFPTDILASVVLAYGFARLAAYIVDKKFTKL